MPERDGPAAHYTPQQWTEQLTTFSADMDIDMVGVAAMDPAWIYEGQQLTQSRVVMLAVAHDHAQLSTAPASTAGAEVVRQYGRAGAAAKAVAAKAA